MFPKKSEITLNVFSSQSNKYIYFLLCFSSHCNDVYLWKNTCFKNSPLLGRMMNLASSVGAQFVTKHFYYNNLKFLLFFCLSCVFPEPYAMVKECALCTILYSCIVSVKVCATAFDRSKGCVHHIRESDQKWTFLIWCIKVLSSNWILQQVKNLHVILLGLTPN